GQASFSDRTQGEAGRQGEHGYGRGSDHRARRCWTSSPSSGAGRRLCGRRRVRTGDRRPAIEDRQGGRDLLRAGWLTTSCIAESGQGEDPLDRGRAPPAGQEAGRGPGDARGRQVIDETTQTHEYARSFIFPIAHIERPFRRLIMKIVVIGGTG